MNKPLIQFRGLEAVASYFKDFPRESEAAARLAINGAARFASRLASKRVRDQVAFSRSYIGAAGSSNSKIRIKKFAKGADIEAVIAARDRPTSLARFASGSPYFGRRPKGMRGPRVRVQTGGAVTTMKRGFFVRLKRGPVLTEDQFNVGLAVRLKAGEKMQSTQKASPLGGGAYLLYGPSVAQVFDTVRGDIADEVARYAAAEFVRQFRRAARG